MLAIPKNVAVVLPVLLASAVASAADDVCAHAAAAAQKEKALVPAHLSGRVVIGQGRAYFHTAPDERCRSRTLFIIPKDKVQAYAEVDRYSYVTYWSAKGNEVSGWVLNARLDETGTGIGPNYEQR